MKQFQIQLIICMALLLAGASRLQAQWTSQELKLAPGWNGVYLHVAPHESTMFDVLNTYQEIQEIWLWRPEVSTQQFIDTPEQPNGASSRWLSWKRSDGVGSKLQTLIGNAAYLVRISNPLPDENTEYSWIVKGRPLPPRYQWTTSGLNFIGLSTPVVDPPSFESFFQLSPEGGQGIEIYDYDDASLNPSQLFALRNSLAKRGQAVWLRRSGKKFNRYFGPFELDLPDATGGLEFGEENGRLRVFLRNVSTRELTVSAQLLPSETPPAEEAPIEGIPPLILRGELDASQLSYPFDASLGQPQGKLSWTLKPANEDGSAADIILGVNRAAMQGSAGSLYAGILRFTDDQGQLQVDIPVSAMKESRVGLWVGKALVNQVQHNLLQDAEGDDIVTETAIVLNDEQEPIEKKFKRDTTFGSVSRPFPLRLILHHDDEDNLHLLQRVFFGLRKNGEDLSEVVLTTNEKNLDFDNLDTARRISAPHLPRTSTSATAESAWASTSGALHEGSHIKFGVSLAHDNQVANPFLHTYHPDHDNKDAEFKNQLASGIESYGVNREMTLSLLAAANDFDAVTRGGGQVSGDYLETLVFTDRNNEKTTNRVSGHFVLNKIMTLGTLIAEPLTTPDAEDPTPDAGEETVNEAAGADDLLQTNEPSASASVSEPSFIILNP